jgi:small GTP-binding protein
MFKILPNKIPLVAFIGLPNSGKTTLLNRFTGKKAITALEAHTTRDLNYGEEFWDGMYLRFVDTGGLVPDTNDKILKEVMIKSWGAISEADLIVWIIDRKQNPDTISEKILGRIWKTGKPYIIAINKVDDPNLDKDISDYAFLGGNGFVNMSCNTGYGLDALLDSVVKNLLELGFNQNYDLEFEYQKKPKKDKKRFLKNVKKTSNGHYIVVRNEEGLFQSTKVEEEKSEEELNKNITTLVFDLGGVVFDFRYKSMNLFLKEKFNKVEGKDFDSKEIWKMANQDGSQFEKLEFWENLVEKLELDKNLEDKDL